MVHITTTVSAKSITATIRSIIVNMSRIELDGGYSDSVYLIEQLMDCGSAETLVFSESIYGGRA